MNSFSPKNLSLLYHSQTLESIVLLRLKSSCIEKIRMQKQYINNPNEVIKYGFVYDANITAVSAQKTHVLTNMLFFV